MNSRILQFVIVILVLFKNIFCKNALCENNLFTLDTPLWQCPPALKDALSHQINVVRYRYNVPPIELSAQLSQDAQAWASTLQGHNSEMEKTDSPYGQSIFRLDFRFPKITFDLELDVLHMAEAENYIFYMGEPWPYDLANVKNFAQIVWKDTKRFGMGCTASPIGGEMVLFVVLFFDPKGLVEGQFKYNVHPAFDKIRFPMPSYGCPEDFQYNFLRRINADRMMHLDYAPNIVLDLTLSNLAQIESNRLSFDDKRVGRVNLTKEYGILTYLKENDGDYQEVLPRDPLHRWGTKRPEYLLENGTVSQFSEETWAKLMQMGIGCTARKSGSKASLYLVFAFETVPIKITTTTTTTPKPTTTATPKPTTTATPKPTTTATPKPTITATPKPTITATPKPTTTTTTTSTPKPNLPVTLQSGTYSPETSTDASTDPNPPIPDLPVTLQPGTYPPEVTTDASTDPNPPIPDLPVTLQPGTYPPETSTDALNYSIEF